MINRFRDAWLVLTGKRRAVTIGGGRSAGYDGPPIRVYPYWPPSEPVSVTTEKHRTRAADFA